MRVGSEELRVHSDARQRARAADRDVSGAPNPLADAGVDRAAHRRRDAAWLAARLRDAETRVVPVLGAQSLVAPGPAPAAVLLPAPAALPLAAPGAVPILLGETEGRAYFALE